MLSFEDFLKSGGNIATPTPAPGAKPPLSPLAPVLATAKPLMTPTPAPTPAQPLRPVAPVTPAPAQPTTSFFNNLKSGAASVVQGVKSFAQHFFDVPTSGFFDPTIFKNGQQLSFNSQTGQYDIPTQVANLSDFLNPKSYAGGKAGQAVGNTAEQLLTAAGGSGPAAFGPATAGAAKLSLKGAATAAGVVGALQAGIAKLKGEKIDPAALALNSAFAAVIGGIEPVSPISLEKNIKLARENKLINADEAAALLGKLREAAPAGMKERGLITSVKESPVISEAVKSTLSGFYTPEVNKITFNNAIKAVQKDAEAVFSKVVNSDEFNADISAQGVVLAKHLDELGRIPEADQVWGSLAQKATTAGQGNQALRMLGSLSPQGVVKLAQNIITQANEMRAKPFNKFLGNKPLELTPELQAQIEEGYAKVRSLPDGPEKNAAMREVLGKIAANVPLAWSEIVDAYRYNNMLSGPNTWGPFGRNIFYDTWNAFVEAPGTLGTRALDDTIGSNLFGKDRQYWFKEVPEYFKAGFNALPEAAKSFVSVMNGTDSVKQPDITQATTHDLTAVVNEMRRQKNLPGNLKILTEPKITRENVISATQYTFLKMFSNFMEAGDRFYGTLISNGLYAAEKARGVADDVARATAEKQAEYYLGRKPTDPINTSGQGKLLSFIDNYEKGILAIRKIPGAKYIIPFVHMAAQAAKKSIEYSPAGYLTLWGNTDKATQLAKANLGTGAALLAQMLVDSNKVTWNVPKAEEGKNLQFAAGRKPFSITIGNLSVPINFFGDFSLALGLVAAWKYYHDLAPEKFTEPEYKKIAKVMASQLARFADQPMLRGLSNFANFASGNPDYTAISSSVFAAGQFIPLNGMLRWITTALDPVFRDTKNEGWWGNMKKDIPGLSKQLLPFLTPGGEPSRRNISDYLSPYSLGVIDTDYEQQFQQYLRDTQLGKIDSTAQNEIDKIEKRIDNISSDTSLTEFEKSVKIDAENKKLNEIYKQQDINFQKAGPFMSP